MRRFVLTLTVALIPAVAWSGSDGPLQGTARAEERTKAPQGTPPEITRSAAAYLDECESYGSSPSPTDKFVTAVDLNDDGEPDYVIDTNEMNASCFCGSGGCTIEAWVSDRGDYAMAYQSNVRGWQVSPKEGLPPVLIVDVHGTACGGVGADICLKAFVYRDGKLIQTTAGP